jgi:hypothetical protein
VTLCRMLVELTCPSFVEVLGAHGQAELAADLAVRSRSGVVGADYCDALSYLWPVLTPDGSDQRDVNHSDLAGRDSYP